MLLWSFVAFGTTVHVMVGGIYSVARHRLACRGIFRATTSFDGIKRVSDLGIFRATTSFDGIKRVSDLSIIVSDQGVRITVFV